MSGSVATQGRALQERLGRLVSGGLNVAVLRNAQDMDLPTLVARTSHPVEKARAGPLSPDRRRHPTFAITNPGMFDVEHFEPIINPPSSVTQTVASALPTVMARDGSMAIGMVMKLTVVCDHRVIDGAIAARFLGTLTGLLEDPDRWLATA